MSTWWIKQEPQDEKYPDLHWNYIMAEFDGRECVIAQVDNADDDARLIAAAPDLLEACQAIAALADGQGRRNMLEVAGQARAAIAKARG